MFSPARHSPGNHIMPDRALTLSRIGAHPIPSKPTCFHRLPEILDMLTRLDASHLDRQAVEKLFGVGPRRARQLMAGLRGIRAGNAAAIRSRDFIVGALRVSFRTSTVPYIHLD